MRARRAFRIATVAAAALVLVPASARPANADFENAKKLFLDGQKSADWKAKRSGYLALGDYDTPASAQLVLSAMGSETNPAVLDAGVTALSGMKSAGARQLLFDAVRKGKSQERLYALVALEKARGGDVDALLVETLASGSPPAAAQAAWDLAFPGRTGAEAALIKALAHEHSQVRVAAARSLAALQSKDAVKPLAERMRADKGRAKWAEILALEAITGQKHGDSTAKWAAVASGTDPATVTEKGEPPPSFFGIPVTGERVAFVLDRSLLMGDPHAFMGPENRERLEALCSPPDGERIPYRLLKTKLQLASAHVLHAAEGVPSGTKLEVVLFCKEVKGAFGLKWVPMGTATRKALAETLKGLDTDDGIDLWDGLLAAMDLGGPGEDRAWKAGPEEILLVTNNVATAGPVTEPEGIAPGLGLKARLRMVTVHVVGIGTAHSVVLASTLAKKTGGTYLDLSK
jgi:hypothetical protein